MEINHQFHAQRLDALRHGQQCKLVAVTATGVYPDPHADGRQLVVVLQQFEALALLPIAVVELYAPPLLALQETHVSTLYEVGLGCCGLRQNDYCQR